MGILKNRAPSQFCQIPNALIIDSRLSMGARVLYCFLRSKPDNWQIYNSQVAKELNISQDTLSKYWRELLEAGWISRQQQRTEKQVFSGGYDYEILYTPQPQESEKTGLGKNPVNGESTAHNNNIKNNNIDLSTNVDKKYNIVEKPKKQAFTKPTLEEIKSYCQQKSLSIDCEYFFDYYESNGWKVSNSPMKDWQATIRNWARRENNWQKTKGGAQNAGQLGKYAGLGRTFSNES